MSEYEGLIAEARAAAGTNPFPMGGNPLVSNLLHRLADRIKSDSALDSERLEMIGRLQEKYVKDTDILFLARKAAERELAEALAVIAKVREWNTLLNG
ncbi:hypothetical protein E3T37_03520 [Cryobacterium sp. TMT2-10]|uniref:hypothetical protein n=1 Tax=Cryobacterium sp. TMT2-10 TaxID=1259244 RepID=UPI0010690AEF|nr:hypothetical protein [Cryobacterium sp. TMT2-10]TFD41734.1 hypothetical protein E3T37_03520 [Cryobacterium sp. TMT2-10]